MSITDVSRNTYSAKLYNSKGEEHPTPGKKNTGLTYDEVLTGLQRLPDSALERGKLGSRKELEQRVKSDLWLTGHALIDLPGASLEIIVEQGNMFADLRPFKK
jgi:hypothetical protein